MGSGKSELLRATVKKLCDQETIEQFKCVPYLTTYRELAESGRSPEKILDEINCALGDEGLDVIIFVDGFDETAEDISSKCEYICSLASYLANNSSAKLVVASRPVLEEKVVDKLEKHFDVYMICPLSYKAIINIVESLCSDIRVSNKFKDDLQNSNIMQALPKTPLSAILLGRLLAENIKELPSTLPELYSKYTDLVLGRWDMQKGNGSEKEYETIQRITALVAAYMLDNDLEFLGVTELASIFKEYLGKRRTGQNADSLIAAFLKRREIIGYNESCNAIFFKHKTFKEFFYATMQYQKKGVEAPISKPFDLYWKGAEYFYLGLIKDAPQRIDALSKIVPEEDLGLFIKVASMGEFLLAAYQTPYEQVESSVGHIFKDLATLYVDLVYKGKESWLRSLPELQLLCVMTLTLKRAYGYDFFLPALNEAKLQAAIDPALTVELRNVLTFFIDSVLAVLGDENAFVTLGGEFESSLDWVLRFGIPLSAADEGLVNSATKKIEKKISKVAKNSMSFHNYMMEVQNTPMRDRKKIGS